MTEHQQIEAAENLLLTAMKTSHVQTLDALLSDDLIFIDHTGRILNKAADLEAHREGVIQIEKLEPSEQIIRSFGGVVYVTVLLTISGKFAGQPATGRFRFSRIWKKTGSNWQVVAGQSTMLGT